MHQITNLLRLHVAVLQQMINPCIHRNHRVKHARLRIGIELNQYALLRHRLEPDLVGVYSNEKKKKVNG
jgi:hypothetical protein